ncbi:MAG TPA: Asp-tRNA(Asn)/Glu-tRNA(Gln) amidotransferase GatCAB subunit B, partial [Kofleriaceae bacterium]|nr:Asp-tRNA(Asn)/Glu-tRNA(Gln) amidotransferase GatCAB subunit B [Kofleriaceae bacterium]
DAQDYRYFPDPDLPPLAVSAAQIEAVRAALPELPAAAFRKLTEEQALPADDARTLTAERALYDWYCAAVRQYAGKPKAIANWMLSVRAIDETAVRPAQLAGLLALIDDGTISGKIGKDVLATMMESGEEAAAIVDRLGLRQVQDTGALRAACEKVVAANAKQAEQYRAGNAKLIGFFVGQVMKETGGKANPQAVNQLLKEILES